MHTDKKGRLAVGSISTKASAPADKKAIWIDQRPGIIEEGKIFFFYRPRKGLPETHDMEKIQRFFIVLMPLSRAAPARLIVVGKKRLPAEGQCFWAAVLAAAPAMDDVLAGLGPKENKGSPAGLIQPACLVGEGIYVLHDAGRSVDMLYELEVPEHPQETQEQLGIYKTGAYAIQIKNPYKSSPSGLGLSNRPDYPPVLQEAFGWSPGGCNWMPPRNPALLDYVHTQFVLIGPEHGIARKRKSLKELLDDTSSLSRDVTFGDLRGVKIRPLASDLDSTNDEDSSDAMLD
ncbi:hypothetical protein CVIRNUC_001142 [Coccomyxa viridis]|uniref:Uncharacterized protein n=1 Tax=Coccomyxa viridis TaxID=1274662 RepID=A0AAV1HV54_9CHLO|nr:hypothetical protein CVIRNUC_001142 [Coccomyxa viridis]